MRLPVPWIWWTLSPRALLMRVCQIVRTMKLRRLMMGFILYVGGFAGSLCGAPEVRELDQWLKSPPAADTVIFSRSLEQYPIAFHSL